MPPHGCVKMAIDGIVLLCLFLLICLSQQDAPICGTQIIQPELETTDRLLGGQVAVPGSWPWSAGIYTSSRFVPQQFCSGALVTERHVITAAHCLERPHVPQSIRAHLGSHTRSKFDAGEVAVDVKEVCVHRFFNQINDIAILTLKSSVNFTESIRPVCLLKSDEDVEDDSEGFVTGWGRFDISSEKASRHLRQLRTKLLGHQNCSQLLGLEIPATTICGTHEYGSTCEGDSGAPVAQKRHGLWFLQGVLSGGSLTCGNRKYPNLFTKVSSYVDGFIYPYIRATTTKEKRNVCKLLQ